MRTRQNNNVYPITRNLKLLGIVAVCSAAVAISVSAGDKGPKPGKGIVHFFVQEHMENTGVVADATGRVVIHENGKSKGKAQDVHIDLHHLDANATYELTASAGQDTNGTVSVGEITTDGNGNASVDVRDKGPAKGKNKLPLPASLQPASEISAVSIQDMNGQTVLNADLTSPDKFEYFVKADMSSGDVKGSLDLKANLHKGQLKVSASKLSAGSDYSLSLNGNIVTTATADAKGRLKIGWELTNPADALSVTSVELLDSGGAVIATTSLP